VQTHVISRVLGNRYLLLRQCPAPSMKIDSTVILVLLGVKSHMASSFGLKCFLSKRHFNMPQEEALHSIKRLHRIANKPGSR